MVLKSRRQILEEMKREAAQRGEPKISKRDVCCDDVSRRERSESETDLLCACEEKDNNNYSAHSYYKCTLFLGTEGT
eukprot:2633019-Rhodomonas_salina.1